MIQGVGKKYYVIVHWIKIISEKHVINFKNQWFIMWSNADLLIFKKK